MAKITQTICLDRFHATHGNVYDYSLVNYTTVRIICLIHGEFKDTACNHWNGSQCPHCKTYNQGSSKHLTHDIFIDRANKVYDHYYDYSQTKFIKLKEFISIICPLYGFFTKLAGSHLRGQGCNVCELIDSFAGRTELFDTRASEKILNYLMIKHKEYVLNG